jgi:transcriptional regulator with XRE-family HTH domain
VLYDSKFGEKIRYLRERKGWKQQKLAEESALNQPEISRIENGYVRGEDQIAKVTKALGYEPESIVRGTNFAPLFPQAAVLPAPAADQGGIVAYFASALTELTDEQKLEIKALDEKIDAICQSYTRYPVYLYRPRITPTSPENPNMPAPQVYDIDRRHVATADLFILGAIFPSFGAGMELQLALDSCSSVILIKKTGQRVSRMVVGCPAQVQIVEYSELAHLDIRIKQAIDRVVESFSKYGSTQDYVPFADDTFEARLRKLREQRGFSIEMIAERVCVSPAYIEALESNTELISNPSLRIIRGLARALLTSEAYLICGQTTLESPLLEHSDALRTFAETINMPIRDLNELWAEYYKQYSHDLLVSNADNRADVGSEVFWNARYAELQKSRADGQKLF